MKQRFIGGVCAVACIGGLGLAGCTGTVRPSIDEARLYEERNEYVLKAAQENAAQVDRLVARLKREYDDFVERRTPVRSSFDVLVISGGGDYGAFGAGLLHGWGGVDDPEWRRPVFDVVTGVSTGALIAPFAAIGDEDAYARIDGIYRAPKKDWFLLRGLLFFLPSNESLLDISGLEAEICAQVDSTIVAKLAAASREGRACAVSATNLDYGMRRAWDIAFEAQKIELGASDVARIHTMLLASSAIPAAFPPRTIDGRLYCDGAVTSNILYNANMRSPTSVISKWRERYPDLPFPKTRFWVIVNNQLEQTPRTVQPTWLGVTSAATETIVRSATAQALELLAREIALIDLAGLADAEFLVASIPDDWRPPVDGIFQPETMSSLASLGDSMSKDPSTTWRSGTALPAQIGPYGVPKEPSLPPGQTIRR
jgi:predicted acylesterase/phospholipase RssA